MVEAQLCLQCGSMDWSLISAEYVGRYWVRKDGRIAFHETFDKVEYCCNKCSSTAALIGIKGSRKVFRELANSKPMDRILKALEYVADGTLTLLDDVGPEDVLECIDCFRDRWLQMHKRRSKAVDEFVERAKSIVAKWKLLF